VFVGIPGTVVDEQQVAGVSETVYSAQFFDILRLTAAEVTVSACALRSNPGSPTVRFLSSVFRLTGSEMRELCVSVVTGRLLQRSQKFRRVVAGEQSIQMADQAADDRKAYLLYCFTEDFADGGTSTRRDLCCSRSFT
jgi:hypothetical protein